MKQHKARRLIRDGDLVAEVEIELEGHDHEWGPTMSMDDALKLDAVRNAMRDKDYDAVHNIGKLYRLTPLQAKV